MPPTPWEIQLLWIPRARSGHCRAITTHSACRGVSSPVPSSQPWPRGPGWSPNRQWTELSSRHYLLPRNHSVLGRPHHHPGGPPSTLQSCSGVSPQSAPLTEMPPTPPPAKAPHPWLHLLRLSPGPGLPRRWPGTHRPACGVRLFPSWFSRRATCPHLPGDFELLGLLQPTAFPLHPHGPHVVVPLLIPPGDLPPWLPPALSSPPRDPDPRSFLVWPHPLTSCR